MKRRSAATSIDALAPHFHSDFHGVMVTGRAVNSFADVQQFWRDIRGLMGEGGTYTTTVNPERSVILGDVALARGTTDDVVKTSGGHEYRFSTLWTATLQKEGGNWKIRTLQGTMDPIGNPFVREFGKRLVVRIRRQSVRPPSRRPAARCRLAATTERHRV